ncbi:hypothetical protein ACIO3O_05270 [Streptomyces sp. NPDC087440]|uniref:hypothetical protein n=1 Tax=Streptomyces sp. NPDC087440 TaxID=3365790 RepID=UPI0038242DF4
MKTTGQTPLRRAPVTAWLARTHADPHVVEEEWRALGRALLPLGIRFDAVRIPTTIIHTALGTDSRAEVGPFLSQLLDGGPVVQDSDTMYALVSPGQAGKWAAPTGSYRGRGWLTVPCPDQLAGPGLHWLTEMSRPGRLCDLSEVQRLVVRGFAALPKGRG